MRPGPRSSQEIHRPIIADTEQTIGYITAGRVGCKPVKGLTGLSRLVEPPLDDIVDIVAPPLRLAVAEDVDAVTFNQEWLG